MKILYRPHRGGLAEAMAEKKEFATLKEMFEYIVENDRLDENIPLYSMEDLCISYYCYDERIDWETYIICDCREKNCKEYGTPQAIGFCTFKD